MVFDDIKNLVDKLAAVFVAVKLGDPLQLNVSQALVAPGLGWRLTCETPSLTFTV